MKMRNLFFAAVLAVSTFLPVRAESEDERFEEWMMENFRDEASQDYMTLHFTIHDYAAYGIEKPELNIGVIEDDYAEAVADYEEGLKELEGFDYDALNETHRHDYEVIRFNYRRMKELNSCPEFDWYFQPGQGLVDNLLTNFTEFVFRDRQDIPDYLTVLASTADYLDDALELTRKQAAEGYFMTDAALDDTLAAIDKFVEKTEDNELIVIFNKNVDAFGDITAEEAQQYKDENRRIILESFIPAYRKCRQELESLRGSRTAGAAVCDLPGGKEYYLSLARLKASSEATVEEMVDLCTSMIYDEIYSLMGSGMEEEGELSVTEPMEILDYLQKHMQDYPEGPEVSYTAEYLDASVANDSITAYFVQPPLDLFNDNVIKINGGNVDDIKDLYSTLAHEGFPGHLYQTTWYLNTRPSPYRALMNNIGYTEGWAMMASNFMWYESGLPQAVYESERAYGNLNYMLDAAVDLGVNGLGWSMDDVGSYLETIYLDRSIAGDLYDFVTKNPAQIVPYGVGLAAFMKLYQDVSAEQGSSFDMKEFNEVLLTYGDRPFDVVYEDIKKHYGEVISTVTVPQEPDLPHPVVMDTSPASMMPLIAVAVAAGAAFIIIALILLRFASRRKKF